MRNYFILFPIISVALASPCIAQSTDAKSLNVQSSETSVTPIKNVIGKVYDMYRSGQLDLDMSNFSIMLTFKVDADASILRPSIRILHSSGSMIVDKTALEVLWVLGESRALGPLSVLSSNTIELKVDNNIARLTVTSFAPTPEEAKAKVTQLSFLLKTVGALQKSKNPMVSELLGHLALRANDKRIDADITVPRLRAAEMLLMWLGKSSR